MSDEDVIVTQPGADGGAPEDQETALTTTNTDVAAPAERKVKKIIRKKRRPARPQVDPSTITSEPPPQTGTTFNIWYNKWSGKTAPSCPQFVAHACPGHPPS